MEKVAGAVTVCSEVTDCIANGPTQGKLSAVACSASRLHDAES